MSFRNIWGAASCLLFSAIAQAQQMAPIPQAQWTPQEVQFVAQIRSQYQQRGMAFTDQQAEIAIANLRNRSAQMAGQIGALQSMGAARTAMPTLTQVPQMQQVPIQQQQGYGGGVVSEGQLAGQIAALGHGGGQLSIEGRSDGFYVNGQPYLDPEGRISQYAYDVVTGEISYIVDTAGGKVVKMTRAGSTMPAVQLATAMQNHIGWDVQTVSGQRIGGSSFSVLPDGVLVSRNTSAFRYQPGRGVTNIAIPEGFVIAPLQRGNVGATGFVLIERLQPDAGSDGGFGKLVGSVKSLGSTLGIGKKEDYALLQLGTQRLFMLNVDTEGKRVLQLSDCQRQNKFVNKCATANSFDSLYEPDGDTNWAHYYWRVNWFKTPSGPIAVSMENGSGDIYITDLQSGKKVSAFSRKMGRLSG